MTFLADDSNIHRVTRVESGERLTLTLWFTLQPQEHSEDAFVLRQLQPSLVGRERPETLFQDCGFDIRIARLQGAGFAVHRQQDEQGPGIGSVVVSSLPGRLCLPCGQLCVMRFDSLQHALLTFAYAAWERHRKRSSKCARCLCHSALQLSYARADLQAYLSNLRAQLPAAVGEWQHAGLLFDTSAPSCFSSA